MILKFFRFGALDEIFKRKLREVGEKDASGKFSLEEAQRNGTMKKWSGMESEVKLLGAEMVKKIEKEMVVSSFSKTVK